jgi:pectate lyase
MSSAHKTSPLISTAFGALVALMATGLGCGGSGDADTSGAGGSAGAPGAGGSVGTGRGGSSGLAGTTGAAGSVGLAGNGGSAGTPGVAGTTGVAGSPGAAGAGGRAGAGTAGRGGTGGATGDAGAGGRAGSGVAGAGTAGSGGRGGSAGGTAGRGGATGGSGPAGSPGTAGSTGGSTGCSTPPPASPLIGWATVNGNTTGGGNATPTTVTTLAALNSAVDGTDAAVVIVQGRLAPGVVKIGSNKTIIGVCGAEIHGHVELSGSTNVIIRNIAIVGYGVGNCALDPDYDSSVGCSSGADAISVQKNAHHIWFDHCAVSDGTDGNLDITNGANYVTVSWTKFHYTARTDDQGDDSTGASGHRYSNLVGGTDSPSSYDDAKALNVTWHHNWWADRVVERQPRVRFGKNHIFNNLYTSTASNYCVRSGKQAQILLENNVFIGVKDAHEFNNSDDQGTSNITSRNNVYTNTSGEMATGGGGPAFTSTSSFYTVTPDATGGLEATIRANAGPR